MEMVNRLKEPSTWASVAVLLGVFGVPMAEGTVQLLVQAGTGIAALAGVFMAERSKSK